MDDETRKWIEYLEASDRWLKVFLIAAFAAIAVVAWQTFVGFPR